MPFSCMQLRNARVPIVLSPLESVTLVNLSQL